MKKIAHDVAFPRAFMCNHCPDLRQVHDMVRTLQRTTRVTKNTTVVKGALEGKHDSEDHL